LIDSLNNRFRRSVLFKTFKLKFLNTFFISLVNAHFLPLSPIYVIIFNKLSIRLIIFEKAKLAVSIKCNQLSLKSVRLSFFELAFFDGLDPVIFFIDVYESWIWIAIVVCVESSEIYEAAITIQSGFNFFKKEKLFIVRI
jgi:hypothetical protein